MFRLKICIIVLAVNFGMGCWVYYSFCYVPFFITKKVKYMEKINCMQLFWCHMSYCITCYFRTSSIFKIFEYSKHYFFEYELPMQYWDLKQGKSSVDVCLSHHLSRCNQSHNELGRYVGLLVQWRSLVYSLLWKNFCDKTLLRGAVCTGYLFVNKTSLQFWLYCMVHSRLHILEILLVVFRLTSRVFKI